MDGGAPVRRSVGLGLAVATVGLAAVVSVRDMTALASTAPGPALAPVLVGFALAGCGALLLIERSAQPASTVQVPRLVAVFGGLVGAAILVDLLGLALTVGLLTAWSARAVGGVRFSRALALAVPVALAAQIVAGVLGR